MTEKERVWRIADRILADGNGMVTVQAVVDALVGKQQGKQRKKREVGLARGTVMLHVREWKVEREYKPRLDLRVLPEPLQAGLTEFAKTVWEGAVAEATARLDDERRLVEAERVATDDLLQEAGAKLDKDAATGKLRDAEVDRLREDNALLRAEVERVRRRLDHIRAEEFWDRVMREVFALIPPRGVMTVEEILPRLRQSTRRGARLHREPLDVETLRRKMDVRVEHGKFFARNYDRTYQREARNLAATAHGET
ncbi:DNA-binding protein [Methylobacterium sp. J-088]|uniref:DNA-binding protein n=1 Tax=Methylobacterium sp. J-088 TaxID=2836664 RepID=UPI001FB9AA87|nr:DNA-binding protein [Methylobacterium sp. J-088]MCJ2065982.1 DNA-binding protein [Methylobacterium sp. J-088]